MRLRRACLAVIKHGVSQTRAAHFHGVGRKSLRRALKTVDGQNIDHVDLSKRGRPTYLSPEMSLRLAHEMHILDAVDCQTTTDKLRRRMGELKTARLDRDADPQALPDASPSQPASSTVRLFSKKHGLNVIKARNGPAGNTAGSKANENYLGDYFNKLGELILPNHIQPEDMWVAAQLIVFRPPFHNIYCFINVC